MNQAATIQFRYALLLREIQLLRERDEVESVGLLLIRVDGLPQINASFGYLGGDHVLEEVGRRILSVARPQDHSFAVSGNTFAILVCNPLNEAHAALAAERACREACENVALGSARVRVKLHIGISLLPHQAKSSEEMLRQCELALKVARHRDDRYLVFCPELEESGSRLSGSAWFDVDEALRKGEFTLNYQPKLGLRSGRLVGAEALIRWCSPSEGIISPGDFMPAIENTQGIRAVLWFALNTALRHMNEWQKITPQLTVSVNVSPANLTDPDLVDLVSDALGVWSIAPKDLVLEITETALMEVQVASAATMARLRELGVRLAIDDFGTGYSSLAYLRTIPAQELKIDRAFVESMTGSERDRLIVASIIQLGHALNMEVVAEGIESLDTMQSLAAMFCDVGQGYYFAEPLAADQFVEQWVHLHRRRVS